MACSTFIFAKVSLASSRGVEAMKKLKAVGTGSGTFDCIAELCEAGGGCVGRGNEDALSGANDVFNQSLYGISRFYGECFDGKVFAASGSRQARTELGVGLQSLLVHAGEHGYQSINVVEYLNPSLALVASMEPARLLRDAAVPRYRRGNR